jgi:hypothetical protein
VQCNGASGRSVSAILPFDHLGSSDWLVVAVRRPVCATRPDPTSICRLQDTMLPRVLQDSNKPNQLDHLVTPNAI